MRSKSLGILVRTLLFGMFLIIPSRVYAEAFSLTVVNLSNLQITSSAGNITFGVWQASAFGTAAHNLGGLHEVTNTGTSNGGHVVSTASVTFANATGVGDALNLAVHATSVVDVQDCVCAASAVARGTLSNTFMVTGVDGPVEVNISGFFDSFQSLFTDQFGVLSQSQIIVTFLVDSITVLSVEFPRLTIGANSMETLLVIQQLAGAITIQPNTQRTITISVQTDSSGVDAIPEPATAVLLLSGLGSLVGVVKRRRQFRR